jgi:hypothetical protein
VQLKDAQGWDASEEPLVARFSVELADFATVAGQRLVIPANLFRSGEMEAFASAERKYPVYFPYTYEVIDKVSVHFPAGYRLGTMPDGQDVRLAATRFITTRSLQEDQLLLTRALIVNSIYFQPEQYEGLRVFFDKLKAADEEPIALAAP